MYSWLPFYRPSQLDTKGCIRYTVVKNEQQTAVNESKQPELTDICVLPEKPDRREVKIACHSKQSEESFHEKGYIAMHRFDGLLQHVDGRCEYASYFGDRG